MYRPEIRGYRSSKNFTIFWPCSLQVRAFNEIQNPELKFVRTGFAGVSVELVTVSDDQLFVPCSVKIEKRPSLTHKKMKDLPERTIMTQYNNELQ